ncbi:hypothetical protein [Chelatococcus sp. YT9]|uniref:hypothetical protein n=1 Tax=Chelatococcus sp. YT9 TaxID=2835635 RepID=UPI001BCE5940|nr:hypothetical protein [Chelatococcus sp. YT9]MBS7701667.1 hypothetical protein [Chelatococcus sp. YT9]
MTKPHNILVAREYTNSNGEVKTEWTRVGVAFPNKKDGFNCKVSEGLALTGDFVILPRTDRAEDDGPTDE